LGTLGRGAHMTIALDALEEAITLITTARRSVRWIDADNPVWLTLLHAEQHLSRQFKAEFNDLFKHDSEERGNDL
jgi:hypothetical protein